MDNDFSSAGLSGASGVPPCCIRTGVKFLAEGRGLMAMTPEGLRFGGSRRIVLAAEKLAKRGATGISIMGTSLTFWQGRGGLIRN